MNSKRSPGTWIQRTPALAALALALLPMTIRGAVPFPAALDSVAIAQDRCDDLLDRSVIIGNGDINALVYSEGESLILRLSKNDVWDFHAEFTDACTPDPGDPSRVVLAPTVSPEHWGWTYQLGRNRNGAFDLGFFRFVFAAAIEGARTLGRDAPWIERWEHCLRRLPAYPTSTTDPPIVVDVADAPPIEYNITVPTTPVFPCDVVNWWSPESEKALFARTLAGIQWNGNNSMILLAVARACLSLPDTHGWIHEEIAARLRPNGTLTLNRWKPRHVFNDFGHYTEQFAATMAISEMLIQSVGDIIRLFPAWPRDRAARFRDLRMQGGFLVSAALSQGSVQPFEVVSTARAELRVRSPWPALAVRCAGREDWEALAPDGRGVVTVPVEPGQKLRFQAR